VTLSGLWSSAPLSDLALMDNAVGFACSLHGSRWPLGPSSGGCRRPAIDARLEWYPFASMPRWVWWMGVHTDARPPLAALVWAISLHEGPRMKAHVTVGSFGLQTDRRSVLADG
jgi:hypothetical protein